ncbi:hypothetical protein SAMN05216330_108168 [Bradyrhizobium sp. Ghvi]|nr:hypothetical protein SAMN05216330_108168 [Bradyrhizobium sp. Ghvi]
MFSRPARQWAEQGYATLRISTRGSGGSGGSYENMTIEGRIEEAMAAVAWLASQSNIDPHKIGILGYNQGAIVATATAGRMHDTPTIKSIALWLPIINPLFYYGNRSGVSQLADGLNANHGGLVPLTTKSKTSRPLKTGFYRDIWTISPAAELRSFDGSMLVAIGTKEAEDVPKASAEALCATIMARINSFHFPLTKGSECSRAAKRWTSLRLGHWNGSRSNFEHGNALRRRQQLRASLICDLTASASRARFAA